MLISSLGRICDKHEKWSINISICRLSLSIGISSLEATSTDNTCGQNSSLLYLLTLYLIYCRKIPQPPNNVGNSEDDACHLPCLILTALTLSMTVTQAEYLLNQLFWPGCNAGCFLLLKIIKSKKNCMVL
jgi:hypothetical protein